MYGIRLDPQFSGVLPDIAALVILKFDYLKIIVFFFSFSQNRYLKTC
jgi:hypothetical protein